MTFVAEPARATPAVESVSETEIDGFRALRVRFTDQLSPLAPLEGAAEGRHSADGREVFLMDSPDQAYIEVKGQKLTIRKETKVR